MTKKTYIGVMIVALAVVLTAGTLVASNMGFKLNKQLVDTAFAASKSGTVTIALPDNRQSNVNTAKQLMDDIGFASVTQVQRFIESTDTFLTYTGRIPNPSANNFNLIAGEAYFIRMKTPVPYIAVGSDDPALAYALEQPGANGSKTGTNFYAYNYHQTAATAKQLMDDIGFASVTQVQRFIESTDTYLTYTGRIPNPSANNFNLAPGEGYFIKMKTTVNYTPSHY